MTKRINLDMLARFAQGLKNKFAKKSEAVASITGESGGNRTIAYTRADGTTGTFNYYGTSGKASAKVYHGLVMPDITALSPKYTGYVFQTTDEELWLWGSNPVQVVPEGDYFFLDTENTILYQWTGSQLVAVNNIATNLDLRAGDGMLIEGAAAHMQASEDVENSYELIRAISNAINDTKVELGEYLNETATATSNLINSKVENGEEITLDFLLPSNYNSAAADALGSGIHEYIVGRSIYDWYRETVPEIADTCKVDAEVALDRAKKALYKRSRPERPTYSE